METARDVYIYNAPWRYNDKPVFIGHRHGRYIYYYQSSTKHADKPQAQNQSGWALAEHLGSASPPFRLEIDFNETVNEEQTEHVIARHGHRHKSRSVLGQDSPQSPGSS